MRACVHVCVCGGGGRYGGAGISEAGAGEKVWLLVVIKAFLFSY